MKPNTQRQPNASVTTPPSSRPTAYPAEPPTPKAARARLRSAGSAKASVRMPREAGIMVAAPIPCSARAVMRMAAPGANAATSSKVAKTAKPNTSTRRRPTRSAARPPTSRKPAKVRA